MNHGRKQRDSHMGSKTLAGKTATWALKAWEQTKAEVESEQPLGSGLQRIFLSPSGFLQLVCFRWVRPGSLAEQQKTYIYIYICFFGFLECIVYTLDESHMGIEFGMKQPLGSIWRKINAKPGVWHGVWKFSG